MFFKRLNGKCQIMHYRELFLVFCFGWLISGVSARELTSKEKVLFDEAAANGKLVQEGFRRSLDFVNGWLKSADQKEPVASKLIGRYVGGNLWQPEHAAAKTLLQ